MTVWMLFSLYPPYTGGAATYSEILARELCELDEIGRVVLLTEYHPNHFFVRTEKLAILGILPRRDSLVRKNPILHAATFAITQSIIFCLLIWIAMRRGRHLVHFHNRYIYRWTTVMVGLLGIPAVADVRDRFFDPRAIAAWPAIICVSEGVREKIAAEASAERITRVPMPIDLDELRRPRRAVRGLRPYFLFVGRAVEAKGVRELLAAYFQYRTRYGAHSPDLFFAGLNEFPALETLAARVKSIRLLGALRREEVLALMAGADRVILPSRSEGLPRSCIEAIGLGVPVVCPPGVREFDRYCPKAVLPEISEAAILEMLERPRQSLKVNSYPIEMHDRRRCVQLTLSVYRRALGEPQAGANEKSPQHRGQNRVAISHPDAEAVAHAHRDERRPHNRA